ncbi:hypothetical protein [Candidatus Uabimicrobium amorphum]|uniref:Lipoprotein n=1 Tax=Uabimicrobium amorphum TaxID=2596890 RepID=A0A5S9IRK4_UABAM|nr:hypothetical protein [Candidatus Uabimicrobium amorphum]BBM86152.1 hypothetical protein UABAM_04538 [Candidatus Uabimicrobium amorphum]
MKTTNFLLIVLLIFASGCSSKLAEYSIISSRTLGDSNTLVFTSESQAQRVSGSSSRVWFLFIPFGEAPRIQYAIDNALNNGQGDFIENAELSSSWWSILLFSYGSYSIDGTGRRVVRYQN